MGPRVKPPASAGVLRIIGGSWRGRKLRFPPVPGLRPTPDRVRETLFNWLAPVIDGARCLDLFAGSGALGFEAASRCAGRSRGAQAELVLAARGWRVFDETTTRYCRLSDYAFAAKSKNVPIPASSARS